MYQFKNLLDVQKKYDYFCEEHGKKVRELQTNIIDLIAEGKDRSGKHVEETLKAAGELLYESFKCVAGYLQQAMNAQIDYQYLKMLQDNEAQKGA